MKPLRKKSKIKQKQQLKKPVKQVRPVELPAHVIAHSKPTMGRQEEQAAAKVVHNGFVGMGLEIAKFEYEFAKFLGLPEGHAVLVSNGTAARYLALKVLGAAGRQVMVPAYSKGLFNAIALAQGKIKLVDIDETANIDLEKAAQDQAEIAIIPHNFGLPVDLSKLLKLRTSPLKIVEDCSYALGAKAHDGKNVGLSGDLAVYSFHSDKVISTGGQGGMVVSKDADLIAAVRRYRDEPDATGSFNFQITDMQAAIGRVQLEKLDKLMARREDIFDAYKEAGFDLLESDSDLPPVRQAAILRTDRAADVIELLKQACVESIVPVDTLAPDAPPLALKLSQTTVSLPIYPHLSNDEVREIIDQVIDALEA